MRHLVSVLAASAAFVIAPALAAGSNGPSFETGPVWDFAQVQTKDGHFDEYMNWLSTEWKAQEEGLKKKGVILDYKVYLVTDPRANEPDIILATEYKNMAAFDTPIAKQYALQAEIGGSLVKANQDQAARGSIRTLLGDVMTREAILK